MCSRLLSLLASPTWDCSFSLELHLLGVFCCSFAEVCSGLVVLDSGEAFYKLVPPPFSLLETLSCMNAAYF